MKAHREEKFTPVTLVLESQAEVDALFSLINHNSLTKAVGLTVTDYEALEPFVNRENCMELHLKLCDIIK